METYIILFFWVAVAGAVTIVLWESIILRLIGWQTFGACFGASLLMNLAAVVTNILISIGYAPWLKSEEAFRSLVFWLAIIVAKGIVLTVLHRRAIGKSWLGAVLTTGVTFLLLRSTLFRVLYGIYGM